MRLHGFVLGAYACLKTGMYDRSVYSMEIDHCSGPEAALVKLQVTTLSFGQGANANRSNIMQWIKIHHIDPCQ